MFLKQFLEFPCLICFLFCSVLFSIKKIRFLLVLVSHLEFRARFEGVYRFAFVDFWDHTEEFELEKLKLTSLILNRA